MRERRIWRRFSSLRLSVLMPVFNEAATLAEIVERVQQTPFKKEILVVDDGSTDSTPEVLAALARRHENLRVHRHARNLGKGRALATALANFSGDVVLIQDADLEYDPVDYEALVRPIEDGTADVVYGSRFLQRSRLRFDRQYLGNRVLTAISNWITTLDLTDMETGYKVLRAEVARALRLNSSGFAVEPEITCKVARMGARVCEVPVRYQGRDYAEGKKVRTRDGVFALFALLRFGVLERAG